MELANIVQHTETQNLLNDAVNSCIFHVKYDTLIAEWFAIFSWKDAGKAWNTVVKVMCVYNLGSSRYLLHINKTGGTHPCLVKASEISRS